MLAIYHRLPEAALLSLNGFGLVVTSLRADRQALAGALYARLRSAYDTPAILRETTRWIPADIVQQTIEALEAAIAGD